MSVLFGIGESENRRAEELKNRGIKGALPRLFDSPALRLMVIFFLLAGCEETLVDPFDNEGRYYTVWGFLEVDFEDTEHVARVIPVTRFPERITDPLDPQADIDAVVSTINVATGQRTRWAHELERLDDGSYAHIFRANFLVSPNATYRLEVERSDGTIAWAETTVPASLSVRPTQSAPYTAANGDLLQDITLPGIISPWDLEVRYCVGSSLSCSQIALPYDRVGERVDEGWRFTVNITEDLSRLSDELGVPASGIRFVSMGLKVRVLDNQWTPPGDVFDPEVLAQPGTFTNVHNGYGFFGSIGLSQDDWVLSCELTDVLGFPLPAHCN